MFKRTRLLLQACTSLHKKRDAMLVVIGSGPAGTACAHALLSRGEKVLMLDVGNDLEPQRAALVRKLQAVRPTLWDQRIVNKIKEPTIPQLKGLPRVKCLFGSSYPYDPQGMLKIEQQQVESQVSFGKGGLSAVWGAAVLPYTADDIADWPIGVEELAPYYTKVLSFMPLSGVQDDLADRFPLYTKVPYDLHPSRQAKHLLEHLQQHKAALREEGIVFGRSRVALQGDKCVYCGMCAYGCPYDVIYNSAQTIALLEHNKNFHYKKGIFVERVQEEEDGVRIVARTKEGQHIAVHASRVFLACGVINTAKIMMQSFPEKYKEVTVQDTQSFLLPLLQYKGVRAVAKECLHTTPQIFLELQDPAISEHSIHMQIYTYNDLYKRALESTMGRLYALVHKPIHAVLGRISVMIGLLHSRDSPAVNMTLQDGKILLQRQDHQQTKGIIRSTMKKFSRNKRKLGFRPLPSLAQIGITGRSYHYGSSFPMSKQPKESETDLLGRPHGTRFIHIVDPSTFPSVPATTIIFTIMANAYRIAENYDR